MKILENHTFRTYDKFGGGHFGASRGSRTHKGVDLVAEKGDQVYSPFDGTITKHGFAYAGAEYNYIEITGSQYRARIFYAELDNAHYVGKKVSEGQFLGIVEGIEDRYPGITPHVHFELYEGAELLDPTEFLKKKI